MSTLAVIIIIVYKDSLTKNERLSLIQCYKVLGHHAIKVIAPKGMDVSEYKKVIPEIEFVWVEKKWTSSYMMNSEFKTSKFLYSKFKKWRFILFYELDAWVFRDDLKLWCEQQWDYIGAPWFEKGTVELVGAGNGGFSLRKNSSCVKLTKRILFLKNLRKFWFYSYLQALIPFEKCISVFKKQLHIRRPDALTVLLVDKEILEDYYWCRKVALVFNDFKIAPAEVSYSFSFEENPQLLFQINKNELPFGCHAWERYEPDFWKNFILTQ